MLDAVAAIRVPFTLEAGASYTIDWITGIAGSRADCAALVRKYRIAADAQCIRDGAATYRQATLQRLPASDADALLYEQMGASIIYAGPRLRAGPQVIESNRRGQSALWRFGISGDLPVVLVRITHPDRIDLARQVLQAHAYWRAFGIESDLVIIGAPIDDRVAALVERFRQSIESGSGADRVDKHGGVFLI